jgi:peptidoglycan hydrolase-like protein with peptidoglycan-binding domain
MAKQRRSTRKPSTVTLDELRAETRRKSFVPTAAGLSEGARGDQVVRLQEYLRMFGYIQSDVLDHFGVPREAAAEPPARPGTFDENTAEALRRFQQLNNLPVTGELDQGTLELMQQPRCGFPDVPFGEFSAQGSKWNTNNLTYAYSEFTPDLPQAQVRAAITQAFGMWSAVTPLNFAEVGLNANPHIVIRFAAGNHGDGNDFDGPSGVLAHAYYPPPGGGALAGDTHFDEAETWSVNLPPSGVDLVTVAAHEFGHALGLAHSNVSGALMAPFYNGAHRNLEADDIAGIRSIYGSRGGWASRGGVITTNIAVARNRNGRLEIFARGTDNALWHQWQVIAGGGWSGWASLGGVITSDPTVIENADGRLEVFARGTDNAVWHRWQITPGGGWAGWASLGGVITSNIAAGRNRDGRLEIFARGTDNAVWHKWQVTAGGGWSAWASRGGVITSQIEIGHNADGRLELFARGTDNAVWRQWQVTPGGGWSAWASLGGVITSNVSVARNRNGRLELFARGTDNALWHKWQVTAGGGWSGWASRGGVITTDPKATNNQDGRLEVFARGTDNAVWHQWQVSPGGSWSGWATLQGVITSNIATGQNADGRLELFVRGTDQAVWHRWQTAPNNGWS